MKFKDWLREGIEEAPEEGPARASLVIAAGVLDVYARHDADRREARELAGVDVELPMRDQDWWRLENLTPGPASRQEPHPLAPSPSTERGE
jgi:hypothetical protein